MEEKNTEKIAEKKEETKSNMWIWVVLAIIVLVILFFSFKGGKEPQGTAQPTPAPSGADASIENLDVEDNPDIGVDDLNGIQISEEEILP